MKAYLIKKDKVPQLIAQLLKQYILWGPVQQDNLFIYKQITAAQEISLDFTKVKIPPKMILFPQTETLLRFSKEKELIMETPTAPKKKTVIFGIRPCDANGLHLLDTVFLKDKDDPYYSAKRTTTLTIGVTCVTPPSVNCFCSSIGGNPDDTTGLDLLLTEVSDSFYIDVLTEKGEDLLKDVEGLVPATKQDTKKKQSICETARKKITRKMPVDQIDTILDTLFESPYWETIAQRCIGCGICTFLCPTCHCFDIQDETSKNRGARVRVWDSCMYQEYTCQASGYNPRATQMNRVRNRIYHKFNYLVKNNQVLGCVGCGRCIEECPVHIDIIDIITKAREVKQ
jgi:sulfhydrogenase subunit beta (sulfur reductase)